MLQMSPKTRATSPFRTMQGPKIGTTLKLIEKQTSPSGMRRRFAGFILLLFTLAMLFAVTFAQALLVSPQQELDDLQDQLVSLEAERSTLEHAVAVASAPKRIVERAEDLGLVRAEQPVVIQAVGSD